MARGVVTWNAASAASNDVADTGVNWAEGQAPSSVNDSARAMMQSVAKWRDDICGVVLVTTGTGTAYALATNQIFAANNNGNTVQFTPGSTNTGAVTLVCDGLGALPLRFLTGVDLPAGVLISGSLYQATLRSSEWLLHSSPLAQPFLVPLGGMIDFIGTTSPNSNFVLPAGQAINRTTYATLFTLVGTTYGAGDGSTTFNVPDLTGRTVYMKEASATRLTTGTVGIDGGTLGAVGGGTQTISQANLPAVNFAVSGGTISAAPKVAGLSNPLAVGFGSGTGVCGGSPSPFYGTAAFSTLSVDMTFSGWTAASGGSGTTLKMAASGIILNKLLRAI